MLTLDRYVARLVWKPALLALVITVVLFSIFNFAMYLREVVIGELLAEQFFLRIALRNAVAAEILLPTTFFFGMVFARCTWHRDREAHALYAAGVSPWRVEAVLYGLCLAVALLALLLSTLVRPWAYSTLAELDRAAAQESTRMIIPGTFTESGGVVITAAGRNEATGELEEVFAFRRIQDEEEVLRSARARIGTPREDGSRPVEFEKGENYRFDAGHRLFRRIEFERLVYLKEFEVRQRAERRQAKSTSALRQSVYPKEIAEYQWRLAMPLIAMLLGFYGITLGRLKPGASPYPRFGLGLLFYILIFNLASGVRSALENEQLAPVPGMFWVPIVMALGFAVMLAVRGNRADRPV